MVAAVFAFDVFDDFLPAFIAEVNVEIRHAHAFGIKKAFEDQAVFDRIDIRYAHRVRRDGSSAAAATGADFDPAALCKMNEIPNDQVVIDKAHTRDDAELIFEPVPMLLCGLAIAAIHAVCAEFSEVGLVIHSVRRCKAGQVAFPEFDGEIAFFGYFASVADCLLIPVHAFQHFFLALEVKLLRLHAHTVFFVHKAAGLHTQKYILRFRVSLLYVVNVVRCNGLDAELLCKFVQTRQYDKLFRDAVILQLDIEVISEDAFQTCRN